MSETTNVVPSANYDDSNVSSLIGLQPVRHRPKFYLGSVEEAGLTHLAKEDFDNSIDELGLNPDNTYLRITMCRDLEKDTYQIIVRDTGRGMPISGHEADGTYKFVNLITRLHTSGKFDASAYDTSAGQFGVGLKATAGCSIHFRLIAHRPEGSASLSLYKGTFPEVPTFDMTPNAQTGTTSIFEPDPEIFVGISEYAMGGYVGIIALLKQYVFFNDYNIQFRILDRPVPSEIWEKMTIPEADAAVLALEEQAAVIWNSFTNDRTAWIRDYWNLSRNFTWQDSIRMSAGDKISGVYGAIKDVILKLYYIRNDRTGGCFAMVNNVPINHWGSDHLSCILAVLKRAIAPSIEEDAVKKFFLASYKMPLYIAVSVKYSGAEFGNATKSSFHDHVFREVYSSLLTSWFVTDPHGRKIVADYFALIAEDIKTRYLESLGDKTKSNDTRRLWAKLEHRNRFTDCGASKDRHLCELFLMEGESASGGADYDTEHQAIYVLGGKPINALKGSNGDRSQILAKAYRNEILSDIMTLINYDARDPDLTALNFGSVLITTDADKELFTYEQLLSSPGEISV